ncbi:MAG: hypothetical protein U0169_00170 [Polyangiaceae bacterium]
MTASGWTRPTALFAPVVAVVAVACGGSSVRERAPLSVAASVVAQDPAAEEAASSAERERLRLADEAVRKVAAYLGEVEVRCDATWHAPASECAADRFAPFAKVYQDYYTVHEDPRRGQGRVDALPRLGGRGVTVDAVTGHLVTQCIDRCDVARRRSEEAAIGDAAMACSTAIPLDRSGCDALASRAEAPFARDPNEVVAACVTMCGDIDRSRRSAANRDAKRPKTQTQANACIRECMKHCPEGKIEVDGHGRFRPVPDDFCGTCAAGCDSECSIAPPRAAPSSGPPHPKN